MNEKMPTKNTEMDCLNCQTTLAMTSNTVQCPNCGMYNYQSNNEKYAYKTLHCIGVRNDKGLNTIELTKTIKQNKFVTYSIYTAIGESCDGFEVSGEELISVLTEFLEILEKDMEQNS
ncbi:MAG: hypothetical protein ACTSPV_13665 [Candidatus Hodarchaeales archaeon]